MFVQVGVVEVLLAMALLLEDQTWCSTNPETPPQPLRRTDLRGYW
jgi:hypothetical protein